MAGIIARTVEQLKDHTQKFLAPAFIAQVARELGLQWRNTLLALPNLVALFARQILGGNLSMPELCRLAGSLFTPEAYCTARGHLPLELLKELLNRVRSLGERPTDNTTDEGLWKGHRLWHMDGSTFSMSDNPELQQAFGQPGIQRKACGFPVAHILCLFNAASGLIQDCILSPLRTHDMAKADQLHPLLRRGDVLIADRAFESFAHAALLESRGLHLVMPVHQMRKVDFRRAQRRSGKRGRRIERQRIHKCGRGDQIVRWLKPMQKPRWMSDEQFAALPKTLDMREIKRVVLLPTGLRQTIVLVTTLLDDQKYLADELVEVLKDRWRVEVNLRHLKTTMKMEVLRSRTKEGIARELWMFLIVYNLVRLIMLGASSRQKVPPERISFADVLYWLRHGDLSRPMPDFQKVPDRPGRVEPRAVKRRPKPYDWLSRSREVFRNSLRRKKRKK